MPKFQGIDYYDTDSANEVRVRAAIKCNEEAGGENALLTLTGFRESWHAVVQRLLERFAEELRQDDEQAKAKFEQERTAVHAEQVAERAERRKTYDERVRALYERVARIEDSLANFGRG